VENFALLPHRAEALTTVLSSRLVALSRCPDGSEILVAVIPADHGTLVMASNVKGWSEFRLPNSIIG